jgi:hypothetical protein
MSVTADIVESWRRPRVVMRRHLARGVSEPFAFSLLVVFLLVAFVAQWPGAARAAFEAPEAPVSQRMFAAGLATLATIPFWYALAALARLIGRVSGGQGGWYGNRLALFWSLVASSPLVLLQGLARGFLGSGTQVNALGLLVMAGFLWLWINALIEVER